MRGWWRRPTLSKAEAQRLLDGGTGDSPVAGLLRAAAGPARRGELAGERDAVAAFRQEHARRAAQTSPAPTGAAARRERRERRERERPARRRVAVLAAALTVVLLGGTGVAAGAGRLPAPLQRAAHDWIERVPDHDSQPSPERTVRAASPTAPVTHGPAASAAPTTAPPGPPTAGPSRGLGSDDTDLRKLCSEWEKVRENPHRKPMDPEDLRVLTAAAGGADRIEAFCGLTPTGPATAAPGDKSKKPGHP